MIHSKSWLVAVFATLVLIGGCGDPEAAKARYLASGQSYLDAGDYEKARVDYLNALKIDPQDAGGRYGLGQALEHLGSLREAVAHYMEGSQADPTYVPSRIAAARILRIGGDVDAAAQLVGEVLALEPGNADALGLMASVFAARSDKVQAEQYARRSVASDNRNNFGVPVLSSLLVGSSRSAEALDVLETAIRLAPEDAGLRRVYAEVLFAATRTDDYLEQLRMLTVLEPHSAANILAYARALVLERKPEVAEAALRAAADADQTPLEVRRAYLRFLEDTDPARAEREFDRLAGKDRAEDLQLLKAEFYLRQDRSDEAEALYRSLGESRLERIAVEAKVSFARLLLESERTEEARSVVEDVRREHPSDQAVLLLASMIALDAGEFDAAISDLRLAIRDAPDSVAMQLLLARAYEGSGQVALALQTYDQILQFRQDDAMALAGRANLHLAVGDYEQLLEDADAMLVVPDTSQQALEYRFKALFALGRTAEAKAVAEQLALVAPRRGVGPFLLGTLEAAAGNIDVARTHLIEALEREPGTVEPMWALVQLMMSEDDIDGARSLLAAQRARVPENPIVMKYQADVEARDGSYDEAIRFYREVLQLNSVFAEAYVGLAGVYALRDEWAQAERTYRQGIVQTSAERLYRDLALQQQLRGNLAGAAETYRAALQVHPENDLFRNNLAALLVETSVGVPAPDGSAVLDEAYALVEHFSGSENPAHLDTLGWLLLKRGEFEDAVKVLERAVALAPDSPLLEDHLSEAIRARVNR